jgi:4-aminobutyrate aminotransferase-like enzyme
MAVFNQYYTGESDRLRPTERALIERREALLGPAYRLFYAEPIHVVRGEGAWLFDAEGVAYLDAYNNVPCVGHCHPRVVEALARQAETLNTHTRYLDETVLAYAERLLGTFPTELGNVMFTCTGSEANDLALRLARVVTGGAGVIVTANAYHGVTCAVAECSPSLGEHNRLGDHVRVVAAPDAYRSPGEDVGAAFAREVEGALADMKASGIKPAALLVDTIFASDGIFAEPAGFLGPAVEAVRKAGGLFIADEVQSGFARTGSHMWGFERHGLVPDLVTLGKPMGNGHPVAGMVARPELLAEFGKRTRYFNTFGGNTVSSAVGLAVLDVIRDENIRENAETTGAYLKAGLRALAASHPLIGDVRGAGLYIGVELVRDAGSKRPASDEAAALVAAMKRRRVLISPAGPFANVLKIRPPLVFSKDNADTFLAAMGEALAEVEGGG